MNEQGSEPMSVEEQQGVLSEFLGGLVAAFGLEADVRTELDDEENILGSVDGSNVGLLVGPRGGTLHAVQELSRAAMQRKADGRDTHRILVDVAGYRERRKAALVAFTAEQAARVIETGDAVAFEPMSSADRKIVHDAAAEIEGVTSSSAGDDPRRHVVLSPAG